VTAQGARHNRFPLRADVAVQAVGVAVGAVVAIAVLLGAVGRVAAWLLGRGRLAARGAGWSVAGP